MTMRIGIFGGDTAGRSIDEIVADASVVEQAGFASYWLPQIFALDAMAVLGIVGHAVPRLELGTAVVPTYPRHPAVVAQQALTVQAASGNRFALGIGLSHKIVIEGMYGYSFEKPVRHMREYLSVLMPLLHDGAAQFDGETLHFHGNVTSAGTTAPPVLIAALGTQMLELTGRRADGTITWMTGPATLAQHTVPTIMKAAADAGRTAPRVVTSLPVMITDDADSARQRAAKEFEIYGMLPSYRAMLDREGAGSPADVAIVGDEAECGRGVTRLADAGVTDFVAATFGHRDERARTRDWLATQR
jgi:F420-dependent oxidoreductase-like protein